jgi:UDP-N-acetylglucosamine 1-carboxyvinyltransferase
VRKFMDIFKIVGGKRLEGRVNVSGSKNAALPIFAAALLTEDVVTLRNVPVLSDLRYMAEILKAMGAQVDTPASGVVRIHARQILTKAPYDMVRKMRASVCLMGPLIGRMGEAMVSMPGGCAIGPRPIDLHMKGFAKLGCQVKLAGGYVCIDGRQRRGADIFMGGRMGSTVTGTANVLMAAVLTPGITRLQSAACEPEIDALAQMLCAMGAKISGIGSHTLVVEGVKRLHGCDITIIPDRIEAGTLMMAAAITGGRVTLAQANPHHLGALLDKFEEIGVPYTIDNPSTITVDARGGLRRRPTEIITLPYPAFPTDLQAQMLTLLALGEGISVVTERVYPNRFLHVPELQRLGADITMEGATAIVKAVPSFGGAPLMASDLRASAALVMAGLAAEGESWVQRIYHLDRGYEQLECKLQALGAQIERLPATAMPKGLEEGSDEVKIDSVKVVPVAKAPELVNA